jgi:hypothetical protein
MPARHLKRFGAVAASSWRRNRVVRDEKNFHPWKRFYAVAGDSSLQNRAAFCDRLSLRSAAGCVAWHILHPED